MHFDKKINRIIGDKKFGGKSDLDGDGIINWKDCQPNNTMRQDEIVHTGGNKKFVYPLGQTLGDTDSTAKFKEAYKKSLEKKNKPKKVSWKWW